MREIGSGRRKEGRQKEMTPYIIVFMISIGLFALSDRVIFTQRKPVVFVAVITLCLLAGCERKVLVQIQEFIWCLFLRQQKNVIVLENT